MRPCECNFRDQYIIWKKGNTLLTPTHTVRVGQGNVSDRLQVHRTDNAIIQHGPSLLATWAAVDHQSDRDGIERYLYEALQPLEGERFPDVVPIPVNLPDLAA